MTDDAADSARLADEDATLPARRSMTSDALPENTSTDVPTGPGAATVPVDGSAWSRLRDLYDDAVELPARDLGPFLEDVRAGDAELAEKLAGMLGEAGQEPLALEGWLDPDVTFTTAVGPVDDVTEDRDPWIGRRIGAYRIEAPLGEGGMGAVYSATRADGAYRQEVAIKLVRRALVGPQAEVRFRQEREILARLDHPRIARILDGGVTDDRVPYLVMEKVDGLPISEAADRMHLTVADRVDLFIEVCRTVDAAHRSLIVHRDLKPANILVDDARRATLLDFGIAKLLDPEPGGGAPLTRTGTVAMTPTYASPEQVLGTTVGTAADVYALGLILFELLVGERAQPIEDTSPTGLFQAVCESRPPAPSEAVSALEADAADAEAAARGTRTARWIRELRGDLDLIVLRAIRKEPERRYGTAGELARDLERWRDDLPVEARPDSVGYRTRKFLGRHRWAVASAVLVTLALVAGLTLAVAGLVRAREAEAAAEAEAEASRRTSDFLVELFHVNDPKERTEDPSARELLDRAAARIEAETSTDPRTRVRLLETLARVYDNLGAFDRAVAMHRDRLTALQGPAQGTAEEIARERTVLAAALSRLGAYQEAEAEAAAAFRLFEEAGLRDSPRAGEAASTLGVAIWYRGDFREAHRWLERALAIRAGTDEPEAPWRVGMLNNLAILDVELGDRDTAIRRYQEALALSERLYGASDVRLAPTLNNLALAEGSEEPFERAEELHRRALRIRRAALDPDHPDIAESLNNLGVLLNRVRRPGEAAEAFAEAYEIRAGRLGSGHPATLTTRLNQAITSTNLGRPDEARERLAELLPLFEETFGAEHSYVSSVLLEMARVDEETGRPRSALTFARRALTIREKAHGPDYPGTREARQAVENLEAMVAGTETSTADRSGS